LTYLERQKCYGPDKKILFKKTIIWPWLTLRSTVKVSRRSLRYVTHHLMVMHPYTWMILFKKQLFDLEVNGQGPMKVMHPHTKYHWPISKDKNVMARTRKYYLKNNYLIWRSKVKVSQRSLRYATHCLMVMHPHTWNWMTLLKKQLFDLEVKGQGPTKVITVRDTPPYGHAPTYQISLTYLERQKRYGPDKLRWEEAKEAEEKIRLKQYVSLRSKGRHNNLDVTWGIRK
jgi:hypothetical protein